jgi:hypothetical protein
MVHTVMLGTFHSRALGCASKIARSWSCRVVGANALPTSSVFFVVSQTNSSASCFAMGILTAAAVVALLVGAVGAVDVAAAEGCWTWIGGSSTAVLPPAANKMMRPAGRCCAQSWNPTATPGHAYLFGGDGTVHGFSHTQDDSAYLADLWELDLETNEWSLIGGDLKANSGGNSSSPAGRNYGVTWSRTNVRRGFVVILCEGFSSVQFTPNPQHL